VAAKEKTNAVRFAFAAFRWNGLDTPAVFQCYWPGTA